MQNIMHTYVLNDTLTMSFKIVIASIINWREFWALAFFYYFLFFEKLLMFRLMSSYLKVHPKF
jgi:hypothetical protein